MLQPFLIHEISDDYHEKEILKVHKIQVLNIHSCLALFLDPTWSP